MNAPTQDTVVERPVHIPIDGVSLDGDLAVPAIARGLVIFAHGSGSSRHSPRNRYVARALQHVHLATLLLDLLTPSEERLDAVSRALRFDIELLATRLGIATDWAHTERQLAPLPIGYFGASTGAAAALRAAATRFGIVQAVVSRGGRPDLAGEALELVRQPTLLIVGGYDIEVIALNEEAMRHLHGTRELVIVPRATHLFEEPGALEDVARLAGSWFGTHLQPAPAHAPDAGW